MEGRKEGNALFNDVLVTFYFTVIWRRTYDKRPLSEIIKIKNSAAATIWTIISD